MGNKEKKMLTKGKVKELGFTDAMIRDLLPEPEEKPNPWYRSSAPMLLWDEAAVTEAMESEEFKTRRETADRRKASAAKGVAKRREQTSRMFDDCISQIEVEVIPIKDLRRLAIEAKRRAYEAHGRLDSRPEEADRETQQRWMVNYIRHNLTRYDADLYAGKGMVGIGEEYERYKAAVHDAIAKAYPSLKEECERQLAPIPLWMLDQSKKKAESN